MTYFYGKLFAMDSEIRAMFPAAMDLQRRRFFRGAHHGVGRLDQDIYISGPDAMIIKTVQVLRERGAPGHLVRYDLGGLAD